MKANAKFVNSTALFAAAAAAASTNSAMAADLITKAHPDFSPTWQGFYVGGSLGASWLNSTNDDSSANVFGGYYGGGSAGNGSRQTATALGFIGTLQAGYNWQDRNFVYGVEGDISWIGSSKATSNGTLVDYTGYTTTKTSKIDALATLRARFGFDFNGTMPYLTAGLAVGEIKNSYTVGDLPAALGSTMSSSKTSWQPGLVVGGGIEHQFTNSHWTFKGEVLWVGFKDTSLDAPQLLGIGQAGTVTFSNSLVLGRIGMNYRF
jgi:outer membrane immunogenic protein